jgi:hypothetical protein
MIPTVPIQTILTFTVTPTSKPCIEAFAILFLTLTLLAIAPLSILNPARCTGFHLNYLLGLHNFFEMLLAVRATVTVAFGCAHLSGRETLTVHFQAFSFFAGTSSFFLLYGRGRVDCFMVDVLDFELE